MLNSILYCLLTLGSSIGHQTSEAPTGLRIKNVEIEKTSETYAKLMVTGRFSGYERGVVWFTVTIKKKGSVMGTKRYYFKVVPRQVFTQTIRMKLTGDPTGARALFRFGELRPE